MLRGVLVQTQVLEEFRECVLHRGPVWSSSDGCRGRLAGLDPPFQIGERSLRQREFPRFLPAHPASIGRAHPRHRAIVDGLHDPERDVRGLVVARIGVRHVVGQRAERGRARRHPDRLIERARRGVPPGHQAGGRRLDVALDARNLPREEEIVTRLDLPRLAQHVRPVDVGVAVNHPEADELGVLEPRDEPQDARLLAPLHLGLEPDEAEVIAGERILPELHARVRLAPGARIGQPHRLHRPEPQRVDAAPRHHLDWQTALEELRVVELVQRGLFRRHHRVVKFLRTAPCPSDSSGSPPPRRPLHS